MHLHNISGGRDGLAEALAKLGIAYGYTVHDLSFACPTITFLNADQAYCGAVTDPAVCDACLAAQPQFADIDIGAWREQPRALLAGAAFVIAPSQWAATTLHRYFPDAPVDVIPHARIGRDDASRRDQRRRCRCPTTAGRSSRCSARSDRTRARAGWSAWSSSRASGACRCAGC